MVSLSLSLSLPPSLPPSLLSLSLSVSLSLSLAFFLSFARAMVQGISPLSLSLSLSFFLSPGLWCRGFLPSLSLSPRRRDRSRPGLKSHPDKIYRDKRGDE